MPPTIIGTTAASPGSGEFPPGLSSAEVLARQKSEGFNELAVKQKRTLLKISAEVAREPMFLLLIGAGAIYLLLGDGKEAAILFGFVFVIMAVTVLQERRSEKALEALRDLSSPRALVMRNGRAERIAGREVVRDDLLIVNEGDRVAADGEIVSAHELATDESLLTGESVPVQKAPRTGEASDKVAGEAEAALTSIYAGMLVTSGQGLVSVTAIGSASELGRIGQSLQTIDSGSSPLQRELGALARRLAIIGIGLCLLVTLLLVATRGGWLNGLLAGITLAMGILPQEFPVILIIFLSLGARRIAQARVLTRRLSAIETLGATTVLCVDKTGTLTQNRMLVAGSEHLAITSAEALADLPEAFHKLLEYSLLVSEITPHDPMEQAIHRLASEYLANSEHMHPDWALTREYELSPDLPAISHLWQIPDAAHHPVANKGAPEAIVDLCHLGEA